VFSIGYSNPFSYVLGRPPAEGGAFCLNYQLVLDDQHHPSAEWVLGRADIIMQPKSVYDYSEHIGFIYGSYLRSRFQLVAESPHWYMYRRLPNAM
jgi:hypothetical protein